MAREFTAIIEPTSDRTGVVHLFQFDGWHKRIGWRGKDARRGHLGSYRFMLGRNWQW